MNFFLLAATLGEKVDVTFRSFDMWVFRVLGSIQNDFFTLAGKFLTNFGDEKFAIPLCVILVGLCLFKRTRKYALTLLIAFGIGTLITNFICKPIFLRVRPYNTLQMFPELWAEYSVWYKGVGALCESDYSFPSGHTTGVVEMAVGLFLTFRNTAKQKKAEGEKCVMGKVAFIFPFVAICTMISRVYLMVHYATDVIGGALVGCFAGVMGYLLAKLALKLFEIKPFSYIDAEVLFKKGISDKKATLIICCLITALFLATYIPSLSEGGTKLDRCEYYGEYDCQNAARDEDDEKYPAFDADGDGDLDRFCKIHWKQLKEGTNVVEE